MAFELLSEPIRKFIRNKGWDELRPIQAAAITRITASDDHFILASRTASGKTEAAFLPILSKVNFNEPGVKVLYISPLIALINDQFYRVEALCKDLEVPVTKWHGEANKTLKNRLIEKPEGIVLITPESLEAMFVNRPFHIKHLFANLKYVVIDEIHSFIGTDRGTQLKSILSRLQDVNTESFSIVGLSATMSEENKFREVKEFTGNAEKTIVLIDRTAKEINAEFRYFEGDDQELPLALLKDLYTETKDNKVLIFPNSRGRAEEIAVKLKKISDRVKGHANYFSHHSSVDREVREYVEFFAKNNNRQNFCIACTSTLELGIDIGTVDEVVQVDATHSIASLIQRVGRSGRKEGQSSNLFLYATDEWSLLQAIACWLLYKEGFIEPPQKNERPYDILVHQALSITKGYSGILLSELIRQLQNNAAFKQIELAETEEIITYLVRTDMLEKLGQEVIIGIEGEKVVNSRDFYSLFKTEENFKVVNAGNAIGEIPFSPQVVENENLLLAAKIWKITFIDPKAKKIEVIPANDGKKPMFFGGGGSVHQRIREKMLDVLYDKTDYEFLNEASRNQLNSMRHDFSAFKIRDRETERPLLVTEKNLELFTFTGTRVNNTIKLLLDAAGITNIINDRNSSFTILISKHELLAKSGSLSRLLVDIDAHISAKLQESSALIDFSKFGNHLPHNYQVKLIKDKYFDVEGAVQLLGKMRLVGNH
jgi:ATP-dependent Lhr-like helicase